MAAVRRMAEDKGRDGRVNLQELCTKLRNRGYGDTHGWGGAAEMAADTTSASQASREGWYDTLVTHDLRWHNSKHAFDEPRSAVKPNPQPPRNSCRGVSVSLGAIPECRYLVVSIPSMLWPAQRHYSRWLQPLHRRHSYLTSSCESVVNHESRNHES